MSNKNGTMVDGDNNIVYPVTYTSNVYDENNISLDSRLNDLKNNQVDINASNLSKSNITNWRNKLGVVNFDDYDVLWQGNSDGSYTIPNISNYKMLLSLMKDENKEWTSNIMPTNLIINEIASQGSFVWAINTNNPDLYKYRITTFTSTTTITVDVNKTGYNYLLGIK